MCATLTALSPPSVELTRSIRYLPLAVDALFIVCSIGCCVHCSYVHIYSLCASLQAFKEKAKFLEMRFRPDDVYAHPIYGDFMMGSSLLLKVTRPKTLPT